jgi:hypothetical protein
MRECSFGWQNKRNYLDAKYYDWRRWLILTDTSVAEILINPRMGLHIGKSSIKQFNFCLIWSRKGVTGVGKVQQGTLLFLLHDRKMLQMETAQRNPSNNVGMVIYWKFVYFCILPISELSKIENFHVRKFIYVSCSICLWRDVGCAPLLRMKIISHEKSSLKIKVHPNDTIQITKK